MEISKQGIDLIKHYESLHDGDLNQIGLQPKMCPAGIWTVGYGRALKDSLGCYLIGEEDKEEAYKQYPSLTEEQACEMLDEDCDVYERRVISLGLPLEQYEFDALVSFSYNVGFEALKQSTLLKYIKTGRNTPESIIWAFGLYNKARINGVLKPLLGLTRRRRTEAELFLTGNLKFEV